MYGPNAEGDDPGRQVAHGAQAQDCPHGRRRRWEARFLDRTTRISLRIIPEGVSSCLPFSVIHASFFDYFPDDRLG